MEINDFEENYISGWIKIFRSFKNWEWYKDSKMVHLFIHLLISANHKDKKWQGILIKRGQILTGRKELSKQLKISEQSIRTCLNKLKSTNELTIESNNKYSLITINNYNIYQSIEIINQQVNQQLTSNQPATNHKQECKELKNEKNIIPPTIEMIKNYSLKRNSKVNINKFFNFYESKNWMIGKNKSSKKLPCCCRPP